MSIDGGAFQNATYNGATGLYEFAWQTPAGDDGVGHTVDARTTDSASNTANATPVTVDNVDNSPTVSIASPNGEAVFTTGETIAFTLTSMPDCATMWDHLTGRVRTQSETRMINWHREHLRRRR